MSPWHDESLRNGVVELCAAEGIEVLAYRPLGGAAGRARLGRDPVLKAIADPDVVLLPGAKETIGRYRDDGWLVLGVSWQPEVERGSTTAEAVDATFARTHQLLDANVEGVFCPHGDGPPVCWCRKPLPGLAAVLIERHRLDPARCLYVGRDASDEAFARTAGFTYRHRDELFRS